MRRVERAARRAKQAQGRGERDNRVIPPCPPGISCVAFRCVNCAALEGDIALESASIHPGVGVGSDVHGATDDGKRLIDRVVLGQRARGGRAA